MGRKMDVQTGHGEDQNVGRMEGDDWMDVACTIGTLMGGNGTLMGGNGEVWDGRWVLLR